MIPAHAKRLADLRGQIDRAIRADSPFKLDSSELGAALPEGALPRGVVQIAAPHTLAGATSVALTVVRSAHVRDPHAWCAWIDPDETLFAPGVAAFGVNLARLLVVRPPRNVLAHTAVRVVGTRAFDVVVVDVTPVLGTRNATERIVAAERFVRKLVLANEQADGTVLLLTDNRTGSWPVALRLELSRPDPHTLHVRVGKDRRGHVGFERSIRWEPIPYDGLGTTP